MVRIVEKLHKALAALEWFTTRQWQFKCANVLKLSEELKGKDREVGALALAEDATNLGPQIFPFDVRQLHWPTYWDDYILGMRKYVLKEDDSTLPRARRNLQR